MLDMVTFLCSEYLGTLSGFKFTFTTISVTLCCRFSTILLGILILVISPIRNLYRGCCLFEVRDQRKRT